MPKRLLYSGFRSGSGGVRGNPRTYTGNAVIDDQRVARIRVLLEAVGEKDDGAEMHRPAPEFGEQFALDFHVLDVFRVLRRGDGRDDPVEHDMDGLVARGIEPDLLRRAVEVAGRQVPMLALAAIHGQLDGVSVGAMEGLVAVQERLHGVLARRDFRKAPARIAEDLPVDHRFLSRLQAVHIDAEDQLRVGVVADLEPWLPFGIGRHHQQHASVERGAALLLREGYGEPQSRALHQAGSTATGPQQ
jgi:hypothetical protein